MVTWIPNILSEEIPSSKEPCSEEGVRAVGVVRYQNERCFKFLVF